MGLPTRAISTAAPGHVWLLSTWDVVGVTDDGSLNSTLVHLDVRGPLRLVATARGSISDRGTGVLWVSRKGDLSTPCDGVALPCEESRLSASTSLSDRAVCSPWLPAPARAGRKPVQETSGPQGMKERGHSVSPQ